MKIKGFQFRVVSKLPKADMWFVQFAKFEDSDDAERYIEKLKVYDEQAIIAKEPLT